MDLFCFKNSYSKSIQYFIWVLALFISKMIREEILKFNSQYNAGTLPHCGA